MATDKTVSGVRGWWARRSRRTRGVLVTVGVLLLIALIGNLAGGDEVPEPAASPDPTAEAETSAPPSVTDEPTEEVEPEQVTEEVEPEPVEDEAPPLAEDVSATMLRVMSPVGGPVAASWDDLADTYTTVYSASEVDVEGRRVLYGASESWPTMVASVEERGATMVQVNLRIHSQSPDWDQDEISRFVANSFMVTAGPEREDLDYVLVYSSDGVEIGSLARRDSAID